MKSKQLERIAVSRRNGNCIASPQDSLLISAAESLHSFFLVQSEGTPLSSEYFGESEHLPGL